MSFLKKHWRFTVPAVVVLCVLLLGMMVLYSAGRPPEPRTVYAMPERNLDNASNLNTGKVPPRRFATSQSTETTETLMVDNSGYTESQEACCPEQNEDSIETVYFSDFDGGRSHENLLFDHEIAELRTDAVLMLGEDYLSALSELVSLIPPDERQNARHALSQSLAEISSNLSPQEAEKLRNSVWTFWDGIPYNPDKTFEEVQSQFVSLSESK